MSNYKLDYTVFSGTLKFSYNSNNISSLDIANFNTGIHTLVNQIITEFLKEKYGETIIRKIYENIEAGLSLKSMVNESIKPDLVSLKITDFRKGSIIEIVDLMLASNVEVILTSETMDVLKLKLSDIITS
ncbi:hypothetical protein, partial [Planomicrobium sp. MB-3u-38]|uniref:hypothetical protein n=1 Tax=Planomicrobium sp. MB-3u-38 TaxID=2058318 RepID=UPI000CC28EC7